MSWFDIITDKGNVTYLVDLKLWIVEAKDMQPFSKLKTLWWRALVDKFVTTMLRSIGITDCCLETRWLNAKRKPATTHKCKARRRNDPLFQTVFERDEIQGNAQRIPRWSMSEWKRCELLGLTQFNHFNVLVGLHWNVTWLQIKGGYHAREDNIKICNQMPCNHQSYIIII